jgi:hypothetical protein
MQTSHSPYIHDRPNIRLDAIRGDDLELDMATHLKALLRAQKIAVAATHIESKKVNSEGRKRIS